MAAAALRGRHAARGARRRRHDGSRGTGAPRRVQVGRRGARPNQVLAQLNADSDIAQLHSLEAAAELAATVYERDKAQLAAEAISKAQVDTDAADLKSKRAQVAQQAALVDEEDDSRAVRRQARHQHRESGPVPQPGRQARDAADHRSDLRRLLPAAAAAARWSRSASKVTLTTRRLPGHDIRRQDHRDQSRRSTPARATCRSRRRCRTRSGCCCPACSPRCRSIAGGEQRYLTLPQTAITYNPYGDTVFVVKHGRASRTPRASRRSTRAAGLRHHRAHARRPGRDPQGHRSRARRW